MEVLLETDPNEFEFGNFTYYSYFSSLCVKYPQEKVSPHKKTQNRFFLVFLLSVDSLLEADLLNFDLGHFLFVFS